MRTVMPASQALPYSTVSPKCLPAATPSSPAKRKRHSRAHLHLAPADSDEDEDSAPASKAICARPAIERGRRGVLDRLPLEVLDLMFSVDSELELRDHLALAGSCVFFRDSYRDAVFQVLFQSRHPLLSCPPNIIYVSSEGSVVKRDRVAAVRFPEEYGPHLRGWREARTIFTSGEESRRREYEWDLARGYDGVEVEPADKPPRPRGRSFYAKRDSTRLDVAWPSPWRAKVAEVVNIPLITAKEARSVYELSDRQLKALRRYGNRRRFIKTSVSALALRNGLSETRVADIPSVATPGSAVDSHGAAPFSV